MTLPGFMNHKQHLIEMIQTLISGEWTVPQFRDHYYDFYLEKVPDGVLSEADWDFFGEVQEKLDWTTWEPDPEEQKYGWLNYDQYVAWVREKFADYQRYRGQSS
jgi:hypothetical protein